MKLKQWIAAMMVCLLVMSGAWVPAKATDVSLELLTVEMDGCSYRIVDENGNEVDLSGGAAASGPRRAPANLPTSYDARQDGRVTSVKSQGNTGCCWAFSSIAALESDAIAQGYADLNADFSESHLAWFANHSLVTDANDPTRGDGANRENPYNWGGNWAVATAALARWNGINEETSYPFAQRTAYDETERYGTDSGLVLKSAELLTDTNAVKQWILQHGAVTASFYYNVAYETSIEQEINGRNVRCDSSYYCPEAPTTNHQVTIIGWNDRFSNTLFADPAPTSNGAWLCKDSWGTYSHMNGYFWLSYEDATLSDFYGMTVRPTEQDERCYSYNGAPFGITLRSSGAYQVANVFRAKGAELLRAAAFYTVFANQPVTVSVYKLRDGFASPVDGTAVSMQTLTLVNTGYHTIDLPTEVPLSPGEAFSVVVAYPTVYRPDLGGYYAAIPVEMNRASAQFSYAARPGESYIHSSNTWYKTCDFEIACDNVYVQAITACDHQMTQTVHAAACAEAGTLDEICVQCGKTTHTDLPATGHSWGAWHIASIKGGDTVECRTCAHCGQTEERISDRHPTVVTLDQLLEMIFASWKTMLTNLLKK